jgi:hypothetical protein
LSFFSERLEPFPTSGAGRRFNPSANRRSGPAVDYLVTVRSPLAFGRNFTTRPTLAQPYAVARVTGAPLHTQGGLMID